MRMLLFVMRMKRAQQTMGMPFGMIFAILLIVVFVVIAGIAVAGFLDIGKSAGVGMFYDELQNAVDGAMRGQSSDVEFEIDLPGDIKTVCFGNLSGTITNYGEEYDAISNYEVYDANVFLVPPEYAQGMQWKKIEHLNISYVTRMQNPYCVDVGVGLRVRKGFYDRLVWVE